MVGINDQIADRFITAAVNLQRVDAGIRMQILGLLRDLEERLEVDIRRFDLENVKRAAAKVRRTNALLAQVRETIATGYRDPKAVLKRELLDLADARQLLALRDLNATLQVDLVTPTFGKADLKSLVSRSLVDGTPLDDHWRKQSRGLQDAFSREIRLGMLAGETNDDLVRRIRGRATGKRQTIVRNGKRVRVPVFRGGVMPTTTRHAQTLVRTAVQTVSNDVLHGIYQDNSDIIQFEQALVTLDNRTTPICMARSGGVWDIMTGEAAPVSSTSEPFPGPPPWHPQCRTILVPITKTWDDILESKPKGWREVRDLPGRTRASMDGQVPADLTYEQWLRTKSTTFQKQVLGKGKFDLWNDGKITLPQLIDQSGRPLTVAELAKAAG